MRVNIAKFCLTKYLGHQKRFGAQIPSDGRGLVEREALVEPVALVAVATEHVPVIGAPGTAQERSRAQNSASSCLRMKRPSHFLKGTVA